MPDTTRSLGRTLGALGLALINATLILLALCLWLGLRLAGTVNAITDDVARNLLDLQPLHSDLQVATAEMQGLRQDLARLQSQTGEPASALAEGLALKVSLLETRVASSLSRLDALTAQPETLIDHAVDRAASQVKAGLAAAVACAVP